MPSSAANLPRRDDSGNFEAVIAGRWLNYVGILALLFAVTFFLKYAFDNNWVGPRGRVGIGLLMGSALYPWSHWLLDRGYKYFSEGIAALGAAVLYLSLWAGWHYYAIFSQSTAFALMIVVTAATMIVAVGRNSERIAFLALLGGLLTPMLVSTGENHEVALFTYLAILGAGVLGIAWVRNWKSLPPAQFAATLIYFWGWYSDFYRDDELATTLIFATVFFILFAALPVVRSWRDGELSGLESAIVLINSLAYLVALREMLWPQNRWALTAAVLLLAAAHLGAERMLPEKRGGELRVARILYAGLALTFVTLAIPVRLDGRWITIAWAIEGAVLIWSGLRVKFPAMRWAGLVMFAVVAGRWRRSDSVRRFFVERAIRDVRDCGGLHSGSVLFRCADLAGAERGGKDGVFHLRDWRKYPGAGGAVSRILGRFWPHAVAGNRPRPRAGTGAFDAVAGLRAGIAGRGPVEEIASVALAGAGAAGRGDREGFSLRFVVPRGVLPHRFVLPAGAGAAADFVLLPAAIGRTKSREEAVRAGERPDAARLGILCVALCRGLRDAGGCAAAFGVEALALLARDQLALTDATRLVSVMAPLEMYSHAKPWLADVRVIDDQARKFRT